jgi:hypothetical protein
LYGYERLVSMKKHYASVRVTINLLQSGEAES